MASLSTAQSLGRAKCGQLFFRARCTRVGAVRASCLAIGVLGWLAACGSVEGPLLRAAGDADASTSESPAPALIAQDMTWQYQLTGAIDLDDDVELLVIDLFELDQARIAAQRAQGKVVVAYMSAGTFESFRSDVEAFPESAIGNTLDNYPDEAWLDVRDPAVREAIAARLALARDKGFAGVVPTNLAGYRVDSGFDLTAEDQRAYGQWLATEAHALGLSIAMAGDFQQVAELASRFDWAVHFGCIERQDCGVLEVFRSAGKPVFDIETTGTPDEVCAVGREQGINVILKRPGFDAYRVSCL
jgi:hypothetical protein